MLQICDIITVLIVSSNRSYLFSTCQTSTYVQMYILYSINTVLICRKWIVFHQTAIVFNVKNEKDKIINLVQTSANTLLSCNTCYMYFIAKVSTWLRAALLMKPTGAVTVDCLRSCSLILCLSNLSWS